MFLWLAVQLRAEAVSSSSVGSARLKWNIYAKAPFSFSPSNCELARPSIFIDVFRFSGRNKNSLFVFPLMSLRANWKNTNAQACINYIDFVLQKFSLWLLRLYSVLSLSHATFFCSTVLDYKSWTVYFFSFYWVTFFISFHLPFLFILLVASVCWYWLPQLTWQHSWI